MSRACRRRKRSLANFNTSALHQLQVDETHSLHCMDSMSVADNARATAAARLPWLSAAESSTPGRACQLQASVGRPALHAPATSFITVSITPCGHAVRWYRQRQHRLAPGIASCRPGLHHSQNHTMRVWDEVLSSMLLDCLVHYNIDVDRPQMQRLQSAERKRGAMVKSVIAVESNPCTQTQMLRAGMQ